MEENELERAKSRKRAHNEVRRAILRGEIEAPNRLPCTDCGEAWQHGKRRHEYDHHLGYAPEHRLAVQPVCVPCHMKRTFALRELSGPPGQRPGRPHGSTTTRTTSTPAIRCTPPQRETFDALGGADWLRAQLDRHARLPPRAKEPA